MDSYYRDEVYKMFRSYRKRGFTLDGALAITAVEMNTSARLVRRIVIQRGRYT